MRLSQDEAHAIRTCADRHFGRGATVRLFGSRADDARRGGDIDLHIEAESPERATLDTEIAFRLDLQDRIGEQKVDVILRRPGYAPRAIDLIALRTGLELPVVAGRCPGEPCREAFAKKRGAGSDPAPFFA